MAACDGLLCKNLIPWQVTNTALLMDGGLVSFSIDTVYTNLIAELAASGCSALQPTKKPVVFKSLCKKCWDLQAAKWGDVATYTTARAKTTAEAVYMQVERIDFTVNGIFSKEAILSCTVHELMHYWSFQGNGLQDYNRKANVDWDEVVADILGFRVYQRTYRGQTGFANYMTPYNTYCVSIARIGASFSSVFGRLWREAPDRERLPKSVGEYINKEKTEGKAMAAVKEGAATRLMAIFTENLFTWFFRGPQTKIAAVPASFEIDAFFESGYLGNMFSVSNAFQSYDGNNTSHLI
jgi:hypothetical protein